jgi:hypothetical protein
MTNLPALPFDPIEESKKYLLISIFYKSKSQFFNRALALVSGTPGYETFHGDDIHITRFNKDTMGSTKALGLISILEGWKNSGKLFFTGGRINNEIRFLKSTLACYGNSFSATDLKAFCCKVEQYPYDRIRYCQYGIARHINMPQDQTIRLFLNPCKNMHLEGFNKNHPSNLNAQIQARAVEMNVDWCPNLNLDFAQPLNF